MKSCTQKQIFLEEMAFISIRLKIVYWESETLLVEVKMVATGLLCTPAKQDKVSPAFKTLRFPHTQVELEGYRRWSYLVHDVRHVML